MSQPVITALLAAIGIAVFLWWILMLFEALRTPASKWEAAGQSQLVYVILMALLNGIGTIAYVVRPSAAASRRVNPGRKSVAAATGQPSGAMPSTAYFVAVVDALCHPNAPMITNMSRQTPLVPTFGALIIAVVVTGLSMVNAVIRDDWGLFWIYTGMDGLWVAMFLLTRRRQSKIGRARQDQVAP